MHYLIYPSNHFPNHLSYTGLQGAWSLWQMGDTLDGVITEYITLHNISAKSLFGVHLSVFVLCWFFFFLINVSLFLKIKYVFLEYLIWWQKMIHFIHVRIPFWCKESQVVTFHFRYCYCLILYYILYSGGSQSGARELQGSMKHSVIASVIFYFVTVVEIIPIISKVIIFIIELWEHLTGQLSLHAYGQKCAWESGNVWAWFCWLADKRYIKQRKKNL